MVDAINAVAAEVSGEGVRQIAQTGTQSQMDFAAWVRQQADSVNRDVLTAEHQVQKLAVGEADSVHEVMLSLEKARLSLELLTQVRNRLLEAYQEISRMQV